MRHPSSRSTLPLRVSVFYTYITQQSSVVKLVKADEPLCTGIRCTGVQPLSTSTIAHTTYECKIVKIVLPLSFITIFNIYRPPAGSIVSFIEELADLIASIVANINDKLLLWCDFNWPGTDDSHVDDDLQLLLKLFWLNLLVHEPTRGESLLDVIASDDCGLFSDLCITDAGLISDHRLIHCKIRVRPSVVRPVEVLFRKVIKEHRLAYLRAGSLSVNPVHEPCCNRGLVRRLTCWHPQLGARPGRSIKNLPAKAVETID